MSKRLAGSAGAAGGTRTEPGLRFSATPAMRSAWPVDVAPVRDVQDRDGVPAVTDAVEDAVGPGGR